jgi:outer membrane immunogenic protein
MSRADLNTQQFGSFDTTRAAFGGHVGYNLALGIVVVGVEADATYANSSIGFATTGGGGASVDSTWNGSVRGRGGITVGPALLYVTAGWGWTGISTVERLAAGSSLQSSGTLNGVVYGLGAETYVLPAVSLRLEVMRYDYGTDHLSVSSGVASLSSVDRGDTVVRAGVTLHFK